MILWIHHFSTDVLYRPPYLAVKLGCSRHNPAVSAFSIGLALPFFALWIGHWRPQSELGAIQKVKERQT